MSGRASEREVMMGLDETGKRVPVRVTSDGRLVVTVG
jgi:hypothetical protein